MSSDVPEIVRSWVTSEKYETHCLVELPFNLFPMFNELLTVILSVDLPKIRTERLYR